MKNFNFEIYFEKIINVLDTNMSPHRRTWEYHHLLREGEPPLDFFLKGIPSGKNQYVDVLHFVCFAHKN